MRGGILEPVVRFLDQRKPEVFRALPWRCLFKMHFTGLKNGTSSRSLV